MFLFLFFCRSSNRRESPTVSTNSINDAGPPLDLGVNYSTTSPSVDNNMPEPRNIQNSSRGILAPKSGDDRRPRRNLRPRTERSYAESPDEPRMNGYLNGNASDSDEGIVWFDAYIYILVALILQCELHKVHICSFSSQLRCHLCYRLKSCLPTN